MPGFVRWTQTPAGRVPVISTSLTWRDTLGRWRVRWCIGRNRYTVPPGLYALGTPDSGSPVLVTANYKLTYDLVRSILAGRSLWLLVLETYGINVWCAAGKGTFGTGELVRRVEAVGLSRVVEHRRLILPLLGAPGVKAREVAARCGFMPVFSVARAADIPRYLDNGLVATSDMKELTFDVTERLALAPVELVLGVGKGWAAWGGLFLVAAMAGGGFDVKSGLLAARMYFTALVAGSAAVPVLLPRIPFAPFAAKGALAGLVTAALYIGLLGSGLSTLQGAGVVGIVTSIASFHALSFTGSTPFTSRSGVKREMALALPLQAFFLLGGLGLYLAGIII